MTGITGFSYDENTKGWITKVFNPNNISYVVNVEKTGNKYYSEYFKRDEYTYNITIKTMGEKPIFVQCFNPVKNMKLGDLFGVIVDNEGYANCSLSGSEFAFNFSNLRFREQFGGGYLTDGNADTPYVAIGICQKIN